ncbi:MAG: hypothetical protein SGARI_006062 [Bacillariaceae sp.]
MGAAVSANIGVGVGTAGVVTGLNVLCDGSEAKTNAINKTSMVVGATVMVAAIPAGCTFLLCAGIGLAGGGILNYVTDDEKKKSGTSTQLQVEKSQKLSDENELDSNVSKKNSDETFKSMDKLDDSKILLKNGRGNSGGGMPVQ